MIVLDVQALQSPAYARRGVGRYVFELVRALLAEHPDVVDALAWNDRFPKGEVLAELSSVPGAADRLRPYSGLRGCDADVLHVMAPFAALARAAGEPNDYLDMAVPVRARRLLVTLYDMIPWRFPERYLTDPADTARYHNRVAMLAAADEVLAISRSAAADAVEMAGVQPGRVTVIGAGAGPQFRPPHATIDVRIERIRRQLPALRERFVLVTGADDWRKNVDGAVAAYSALPDELRARHQLVVAGAGVGAHGNAGDVVVASDVSDELLVDLYQSAEVVVVPSRYEGFGLPVVEARACGARVICSDVSSLPEALPEPRARFDPEDVTSIVGVMEAALTDPELRAALEAVPTGEHTWSATAEKVAHAYRRHRVTVGRRSPHAASPALRLAVVSVIPPTVSGIATHTERVVAALARFDDVDVSVFTPSSARRLTRCPDVAVAHLTALPERWLSGAVDAVVYCIGNGLIHRPIADMSRLVPGHLFLHDVRTPLLWGADTATHPSPAAEAVSVMVQSKHAAQLLEELDGIDAAPIVDVGPHPFWNDGSTESIGDDGPPWVVSAGIAHEAKQTDRFVAAVRILEQRRPVRAAIVGDGGGRFVGDDDHVVVTGHVDDRQFDTWLRSATLMVQLRADTNGESSGVAAHAVARGVPLVVTDIGAMRELPSDVVHHVSVDITPEQLADVLDRMLADPPDLKRRRQAALELTGREPPAAQARRIVDAVRAMACEDGNVSAARQVAR